MLSKVATKCHFTLLILHKASYSSNKILSILLSVLSMCVCVHVFVLASVIRERLAF